MDDNNYVELEKAFTGSRLSCIHRAPIFSVFAGALIYVRSQVDGVSAPPSSFDNPAYESSATALSFNHHQQQEQQQQQQSNAGYADVHLSLTAEAGGQVYMDMDVKPEDDEEEDV